MIEFFSQIYGLYLIEILHQTTTGPSEELSNEELYLIEILHQTTTVGMFIPVVS